MTKTIQKLADDIFLSVKGYIGRAIEPIGKRIDGIESTIKEFIPASKVEEIVRNAFEAIRVPKDGKDGERGADGVNGKDGLNGKDVTQEMVEIALAKMLPDFIEKAIDRKSEVIAEKAAGLIPKPKDGLNGKDGESVHPDTIILMVKNAVDALPKPKDGVDGKSADMELIYAKIDSGIEKAISAIPVPKDGKDGLNGKDADPVEMSAVIETIERQVNKAVSLIPTPKDGERGTDGKDYDPEVLESAVKRAAESIRVPQDGKSVTIDEVLPIIEGAVSRWEVDFERRAADVLQRAVDKIPEPKAGENGKDGFSPDDFTLEAKDGGRTIVVVLKSGDRVIEREITLAVPLDRGVYKSGEYKAGDAVTYAGSLWIAQCDTKNPPGDGSGAWRLSVKRGKDGRDSK